MPNANIQTPECQTETARDPQRDHIWSGLNVYCLTCLIVFLGVEMGRQYVKPTKLRAVYGADYIGSLAAWDGRAYVKIAVDGYSYHPDRQSNVAFFPAFPLLGRVAQKVLGCRTDFALVLVAHLALAAVFVLFSAYVQCRFGPGKPRMRTFAVVAFGLWPTTFFFRMAYSESIFLLAAMLVLYGLQRRWPLLAVAVISGAATAVRPVGVALLPVLALAAWRNSNSVRSFAQRLIWLVPLSVWGLVAYITFQAATFREPFAFANTQKFWRVRPDVSTPEHVQALATFEPLWSVFDPSSPCFWGKEGPDSSPFFSLAFGNPIYFVIAVAALVLGIRHRWLNTNEVVFSLFVLLIPYFTRSYENCSCSMGRFAAVAFPVYIVMGHLLARMPIALALTVLGFCGFFLGIYAALFAAEYAFY